MHFTSFFLSCRGCSMNFSVFSCFRFHVYFYKSILELDRNFIFLFKNRYLHATYTAWLLQGACGWWGFSDGDSTRSLWESGCSLVIEYHVSLSLQIFWCLLKCKIALCFSLWVSLTWSVDWNDVEAATRAHMCTPCIPQPRFYVKSDRKQARHTSQSWAGWSTLFLSCPHPHRNGKEGSGWAWNILHRGWEGALLICSETLGATEGGSRAVLPNLLKTPEVQSWAAQSEAAVTESPPAAVSWFLHLFAQFSSVHKVPCRASSVQELQYQSLSCVSLWIWLVLIKKQHVVGKEGCFCKSAYAMVVFHLHFNLLRSTQTNIQMPVQSRRVLHPPAPPSAVGVVFIMFVLGGYTSCSVSALAASGRSKTVLLCPGALSGCVVVTALGGKSDCACAHGAGTAGLGGRLCFHMILSNRASDQRNEGGIHGSEL